MASRLRRARCRSTSPGCDLAGDRAAAPTVRQQLPRHGRECPPLLIVAILGAVHDSRLGLPRASCATAFHTTRGPQGRPFAIDVNVMCVVGGDSFAECDIDMRVTAAAWF